MLMEKERKQIVEYGKKMLSSGLTAGTAGNISIYDPNTGYMAITPSGVDYYDAKPEDIVIMDFNGKTFEGSKKPSSEYDLHVAMYKQKPEIRSVVHTHSTYCTVLGCLEQPLKAVHYVLADAGVNTVPIAPYHTYGTMELAEVVAKAIGNSSAALMANHGMIACGTSIKSAYGLAATCEWVAEIQWRCMAVGKPNILTDEQMKEVKKKFETYGQISEKGEKKTGYFG